MLLGRLNFWFYHEFNGIVNLSFDDKYFMRLVSGWVSLSGFSVLDCFERR
jgi:hypothetical protein